MFGNTRFDDVRVARMMGDIALMSRLHLSLKDVKSLSEKKREAFLWYLKCEDRKIEMKRKEAELRSRR